MSRVKVLKRIVPRPLRPFLGAARRWVKTFGPRPFLYKKRLLSDPSLSRNERELLRKMSTRIYHRERMYNEEGVHYYEVAISAIRCIDEGLERANLRQIRSVLDLPCGGGRVLRLLVHRFPHAEITACDLAPGAAEFCARTFGAQPATSSPNLDEVSLGKKFDLIWCGSLVTHLNDSSINALLRLFKRHLAKGGIVVFTTHGDFVHQRISKPDFDYGLDREQTRRIVSSYPTTGFEFENYPGEKEYGVSVSSRVWVRARVRNLGGLREVFFKERGWDDHQDVFGFVSED